MTWNIDAERRLVALVNAGHNWVEIGKVLGVSPEAARSKYRFALTDPLAKIPQISDSPYPVYDKPLETEGDALVISDPEFPFHHAEFLNRILDLAVTWGITNCVIAGDILHFNSLSAWEPAWQVAAKSGISEDAEKDLLALDLPAPVRQKMIELIQKHAPETNDDTVGEEIKISRRELVKLSQIFKRIDYVLGNHDGRFLSALNSPLFPQNLLDFVKLDDPAWRIACFYFSFLHSGGRTFRIEHPKSAAKNTAVRLADKYECSILMGHSHFLDFRMSTSGRHYACQMGAVVDERRLPYAAQRSVNSDTHALGSVLVRDGVPWLLTENSPWDRMKRM